MKLKVVSGVLVVALVAAVTLLLHPWSSDSSLPADAAFKLGGRVVTVSELNARDKALTALYGVQQPAGGKALDTFKRQAAKSMAINLVLGDAIAARHISVPNSEVKAAQQALISSQFGGSQTTFSQTLITVGVTQATVTQEIRRQLELRVLLDQVAGKVSATDAEAVAAFPANKASLGTPERRVVYNIVVSTQAAAIQVRKSLDGGASVTSVAKQVSIDGATRSQGGLLGTIVRSQLLPAVGNAVFAVKAGQAYGPVQGTQGWNVGKVTRVIPSAPATLTAAMPALRIIVVNQKKQASWSRWLAAQLRAAHVQYAAAYLPKNPFDVSAWTNPSTTSPASTDGVGQ